MSPVKRSIILFLIGFNLGAWPPQSNDPTFYYLIIFSFYGFYNRLKIIFLDPSFLGSVYPSLNLDEKNILTWDNVTGNMSSVSIYFFGGPVVNQLGGSGREKKFASHFKTLYFYSYFPKCESPPRNNNCNNGGWWSYWVYCVRD